MIHLVEMGFLLPILDGGQEPEWLLVATPDDAGNEKAR
jgi:hypothetical protein